MNDYSDLFFLMGAMVVFSLLSLNVNRAMFLSNNQLSAQEIEYTGIATGQDLIDKARFQTQDEVTPGNASYRWADYDDCDKPFERKVRLGKSNQYEIAYEVCIEIDNSKSDEYDINVFVSSDYMKQNDGTKRVIALQSKRYF